jgi:UDPglucose--hexose-1-phosphate uridylyltransferase
VVCFSPRHDLTLAEMDAAKVRGVVDAWARETETLGRDPALRYVQVFENKGAMMGCSNPHPHGQIWAARVIAAREAPSASISADGRQCPVCRQESSGPRVIDDGPLVAVVPFWASWPFELARRRDRRRLGARRGRAHLAACIGS